MFILFKAPPEKDLEWDDADVEGQFRFLQRIWRLVESADSRIDSLEPEERPEPLADTDAKVRRAIHIAIDAVSEDLQDEIQLNTAISELMKLTNAITSVGVAELSTSVLKEALSTLLRLLAPFAPHLAEELWHQLGGTSSVHRAGWPELDPSALVQDSVDLVIQIKGKVRGTIQVPAAADKEQLEALALASEIAAKWLEGHPPRRVIVVPGKLVNLVP
jgi:leucyl-tRNA synthetase